jgi:hypothetical protein
MGSGLVRFYELREGAREAAERAEAVFAAVAIEPKSTAYGAPQREEQPEQPDVLQVRGHFEVRLQKGKKQKKAESES